MPPPTDNLPPIGAVLAGRHWPCRVRVVRAEPHGAARALIEAVTLDDQARLISRLFRLAELSDLTIEEDVSGRTLDGDPLGFKLAAEATRIRLAYTYDPLFAVSVARIDPLTHQLEAVYGYMLRQPRLRFLLAVRWTDSGRSPLLRLILPFMRGAIARQAQAALRKLKDLVEGQSPDVSQNGSN